jgi:hypothetical protein
MTENPITISGARNIRLSQHLWLKSAYFDFLGLTPRTVAVSV